MIRIICTDSLGMIEKEEELLEGIAGLQLALRLRKYGFSGYRLESCMFHGSKKELAPYLRKIRKRGCWCYVVKRKRREFLLFTDSPAVLACLQPKVLRLSALEVLVTAFGRP